MDGWMIGMIGMIRNMSHVDNEKTPFCALYTSVHISDSLEWLRWLMLVAVGVVWWTVLLLVFTA